VRLGHAACRWRLWVEAGSVMVTDGPKPVGFVIVESVAARPQPS
jgi:hypothetical protein